MHIYIKNKKILFDEYKVKCAIGKRGIGVKKKEGDNITPKGRFRIKSILYRKDRVSNLKSNIKKLQIKRNMGWCDDPKTKNYNKLIYSPFKFSAEKLYRKDNIYDVILVLNFNTNPIQKNKGSAIFIHIAKKKYKDTKGCVGIYKKDMRMLVKKVSKKSIVFIS